MIIKLGMAIVVLLNVSCAYAQSLPRWPAGSRIAVVAEGFNDKETKRIESALAAWRPLLPQGLTMETATTGNVRLLRERVSGKLDECEISAERATCRIDPAAGSGERFQMTVEHAIGHVLGLGHRPDSVMQARASNSLRIGFWRIEKLWHPSEQDRAQLAAMYSAITSANKPVAVVAEAPPTPTLLTPAAIRYAFRRVVTDGKHSRASTFTFNDRGQQIETDISGSNDKRLRSVPMFPVGTTEAVFAHWKANPVVHEYDLAWSSGKTLSIDGAGDADLKFPVEAYNGKLRAYYSNYRLFRTTVTIKDADP